ncbi:hypothetical protein Tco_0791369 [Tanacetum coccineum]
MVAYLEKSEGSEGFHQIIDFLTTSHIKNALTECPTLYASPIEQFWQTIALSTNEDGVSGITATIDRKVKVFVSEASIRRHLKLEDSEGLKTLPTAEIFEQLTLIGFVITSDSLTFQKGHFSPQWKFLIHTILHCLSPKKTAWEQFSSNIATAIICLATKSTFNFSNLIFEAMVKNIDSRSKFLMYPRFIQIFLNKRKRMLFPHKKTFPTPTLTQKLFSNMKRASKGYSGVDIPLFPTMLTTPDVHLLGRDEGSLSLHELTDLYTSMSKKKLEQTIKTSQARRRAKVVISDDEEAEEDPSNQGRSLIEELDLDAGISLLCKAAKRRQSVENVQTYTRRRREVSTGSGGVSTASKLVSIFFRADIITSKNWDSTAIVKARTKAKELAKKVFEEEQARFNAEHEARFKAEQEQERINFETALELQKQLDEREEVTDKVDQAHDIDWSDPAVIRYHTLQNRRFSVAEVRKNKYSGNLKNQESYEEIRICQQESSKPVEEEIVQQDDAIAEQAVKESSRIAGGRRNKSLARKRARETLSEESAKKQKLEDDTEKEELQVYLNIVPEEESLNIESLATKQDVLELYRLVKERFQTASPEGYDLLLWGDLKIMMEPNGED